MPCDYLPPLPHANPILELLKFSLTEEFIITGPKIPTPSSGIRPLRRVKSGKVGHSKPNTILQGVLIHSGSL